MLLGQFQGGVGGGGLVRPGGKYGMRLVLEIRRACLAKWQIKGGFKEKGTLHKNRLKAVWLARSTVGEKMVRQL